MSEKPKTVRQEWQALATEIQTDVNQTLEELQLEIELVNEQLRIAFEQGSGVATELASDAIRYLDKKWGYIGDIFLITGKWYIPTELVTSVNGVLCQQEKQDAFHIARSNGFVVGASDMGEGGVPTIGLSFVVANTFISTASMQGRVSMLAYALPQEISLQYMRPRSEETVGASVKEVSDAISQADAVLAAYINHDKSTFYNASAAKQGAFLQSVIDSAALALPPKETLDRVVFEDTFVSSMYVQDAVTNKIYSIEAEDQLIKINHGVILDFATIDTLRDGVGNIRYTEPSDLSTYDDGLCAVVSAQGMNIDLSGLDNPDIIVPFRRIVGDVTISIESPSSD